MGTTVTCRGLVTGREKQPRLLVALWAALTWGMAIYMLVIPRNEIKRNP
jgi:hypothetical protein